jgi:hypothetical protein
MFRSLSQLLSRRILLAFYDHVHFGRADPAAIYAGDFQTGSKVQRRNCLLQDRGRNSGIDQCAQEHVATYAGKTI